MPLTPYLGSFDPEEIETLTTAFDAAWREIQPPAMGSSADAAKDRVARLIVHRAQSGPFDKETLVNHALKAYALPRQN